MKQTMRPVSDRVYRGVLSLVLCAAVFSGVAGAAAAHQKDKKKKDTPAPDTSRVIPLAEEQQVDYVISSMLGAWQIGDVDKLHESFGEDVVVVNGVWAPPTIGWTNYSALYQQQRARMQQVRMDRSNTVIRVEGTVGWACYQWDFSALVDGQPSRSQGLTTLVMSKRNNHWVIVLNHTSLAQAPPKGPGNTTPATQPPAKPGSH